MRNTIISLVLAATCIFTAGSFCFSKYETARATHGSVQIARDDAWNNRPQFARDDAWNNRPQFARDDAWNNRPQFARDDAWNNRPQLV